VNERLVEPIGGPVDATIQVPGSKSLTNRALVCAALGSGRSTLDGVLFADDTEAMLDGLRRLGIGIVADAPRARVVVHGCGGLLPSVAVGARLDARMSGTTSRFLLPLLALGPGPTWLDGALSLQARPMGDGIAALRHLGVDVVEQGGPGHLPVAVRAGISPVRSADTRGPLRVSGASSSQFLSGLLMAAPALPGGLELVVDGPLVSRSYVDMTVAVMRSFGAEVEESDGDGAWTVAPTGYGQTDYAVEPDASAASYFFAAAAICGGRVTVEGLGRDSLQGDIQFVEVLAEMGCRVEQTATSTTVERTGELRGVDVDMADMSDQASTLAAVAVFADSPTQLRGIGFIRAKESDRIGDVVRELGRCGIKADEEADGYVVYPGRPTPAVVQTYDDHRMAMSFSLLGLRAPGITIADPDCVAKTFPDYWDTLDRLYPPVG
jgi:3-phosphoshikimate 1-carboxyvinyltransferase